MIHKMNLNDEPFNSIKKGFKTIEMRLYDEKRRLINIGNIIEFNNRTSNEKIYVKVIQLHIFNNFKELYESFDKVLLGYKEYDIASPNDMNIYYSKEEQDKYGVVGIEIKLI